MSGDAIQFSTVRDILYIGMYTSAEMNVMYNDQGIYYINGGLANKFSWSLRTVRSAIRTI